jgi:hypothetical protein
MKQFREIIFISWMGLMAYRSFKMRIVSCRVGILPKKFFMRLGWY